MTVIHIIKSITHACFLSLPACSNKKLFCSQYFYQHGSEKSYVNPHSALGWYAYFSSTLCTTFSLIQLLFSVHPFLIYINYCSAHYYSILRRVSSLIKTLPNTEPLSSWVPFLYEYRAVPQLFLQFLSEYHYYFGLAHQLWFCYMRITSLYHAMFHSTREAHLDPYSAEIFLHKS